MTSDRNKCSLSSFWPMSCQRRAETFARHLHSRLSSLGSTESEPAGETSWLAAPENTVTSSQPRQSDPDLYFDFGTIESPPGSPQEEKDVQQIENAINQHNLTSLRDSDCTCTTSEEDKLITHPDYLITSNSPKENMNGHAEAKEINSKNNGNEEINYNDLETNSLSNEEVLPLNLNDSSDDCKETCLAQVKHVNGTENLKLELNTDCSLSETIQNGLDCIHITSAVTEEPPNVNVTENHWQKLKSSFSHDSDDEHDDSEERIPRVRRCSSLKTGKTPPGTPSRKKIVRFADVLGLDLADVRTFLDEIPKIPNSAYNDLKEADLSDPLTTNVVSNTLFQGAKVSKVLVPLFQQPGGQPDFIDRIRDRQVCLDNALVDDPVMLSITGTVRVKNLDFHKSVHIRYTLDSWQTFADVQAIYVENSCDGFSDKFSFTLFANTLPVGQKLEFAIRFQCRGCQYWDNNKGANYCFQCLPPTDPTPVPTLTGIDDSWSENLYY